MADRHTQAAAVRAPTAADGTGLEPSAGAWLEFGLKLEGLTGELRRARELAEARHNAIYPDELPARPANVSGGAGQTAPVGPSQGYAWHLTRVTVAGLNTADQVSIYRNAVGPQNLCYIVTGAAPTWHPGGKSGILRRGQTLLAAGTGLTTGTFVLVGEMLEMVEWMLTEYVQ